MYTVTLIVLFIFAVVLLYYGLKNLQNNENANHSSDNMAFELLDENGYQIHKSVDSTPSSGATTMRVVVGSLDDKDVPVQQLRYFCIKDNGYHVSVWPKDRAQFDVIEFSIAGITHGEHVDDHLGEFIAALIADPDNQYDPQAIKIVTREDHRIGYVPRDMTSEVRSVTTLPCTCYCYIGTYHNADGPHYFTHCYIDRY